MSRLHLVAVWLCASVAQAKARRPKYCLNTFSLDHIRTQQRPGCRWVGIALTVSYVARAGHYPGALTPELEMKVERTGGRRPQIL